MKLIVNLDQVAAIRQSKYPGAEASPAAEPSILEAASACERAGAQGISVHLRTDRRHVQEEDVYFLRKSLMTKLTLRIANTRELLEIALRVLPEEVCLVAETRQESSPSGGLDILRFQKAIASTIQRLQAAGIRVGLAIDGELSYIETAANLGVEMIEIRMETLAQAVGTSQNEVLLKLKDVTRRASQKRLSVNAGRGIHYKNISRILKIPGISEIDVGHAIISRGLTVGLETAVQEMVGRIADYES